jgi:hypothetical protein
VTSDVLRHRCARREAVGTRTSLSSPSEYAAGMYKGCSLLSSSSLPCLLDSAVAAAMAAATSPGCRIAPDVPVRWRIRLQRAAAHEARSAHWRVPMRLCAPRRWGVWAGSCARHVRRSASRWRRKRTPAATPRPDPSAALPLPGSWAILLPSSLFRLQMHPVCSLLVYEPPSEKQKKGTTKSQQTFLCLTSSLTRFTRAWCVRSS